MEEDAATLPGGPTDLIPKLVPYHCWRATDENAGVHLQQPARKLTPDRRGDAFEYHYNHAH